MVILVPFYHKNTSIMTAKKYCKETCTMKVCEYKHSTNWAIITKLSDLQFGLPMSMRFDIILDITLGLKKKYVSKYDMATTW